MQTLYKKDARQFISVFVKKLDIADYNEVRSKFEKYLKTNNLECIITSTEKIVYAYGKKVEQYLNFEMSNYLKDLSNDIHFGGMRSTNLEIVKGKNIKRLFYCEPLKSFKTIGCIIIFYKHGESSAVCDLLEKIR